MQPSHTRQICRAHNRFTPSIALWQHFVAPNRPTPSQLRHASSTTEAAQRGADTNSAPANGTPVDAQETSGLQQPESEVEKTEESGAAPKETSANPAWKVRRMTTVKGPWEPSKAEASIKKNVGLQEKARKAAFAESDKLLAIARAAFDDAKEYDGVIVRPMINARPIKESELPWCLKTTERTVSGIERLNTEIERFYNYTKPGRFESIARKHLIEQVRKDVRKGLSKYVVEVFGSERTGVAFATSDIDFRLLQQSTIEDPAKAKLPPTSDQRGRAFQALKRLLRNTIAKQTHTYLLPALRHARYPLISAQDRQSGLDIQIVLSNDTSVSRVIMQGYMEEYPYLRQLYYVVKTIFDVRGLSDVFRGGFGSYSLFMMVVASLKHAPHPRRDAAGGLINFLKFWRDFDTRKQGVSIEPAFLFDKAEYRIMTDTIEKKLQHGSARPLPEYMLALRDPADETNDLGRKGIAIKHVQVTLKDLSHQLEVDRRTNTRPSLLGPLVGTSYMNDYARRRKLQTHGHHLLDQMHKSMAAQAKAVREGNNLEAEESEDSEVLKRQLEEEETKQRLAKEERDRAWQKLADERNERLREVAQRTSVLEHGEAMASILGMPAVEEEAQATGESKKA